VSAGPFTPEVSVEHPEALRQAHIDFARAGAQVLQALTYYAHKDKLKSIGCENSVEEINKASVQIAREVAREYGCMVAGGLSNTWTYDPRNPATAELTRRQFDEQIKIQVSVGVDFFIAETIEHLGEALVALEAIKATRLPAMITLGFKRSDRTREGIILEDAFKELESSGADIVGINCFRDPARMLPLAARMKKAVSCFVATQPVAFRCTDDRPYFQIQEYEGHIAFPLELDPFVLTRKEMASYAVEAQRIGINYIGGCCGTAPHHLRAMAESLGRTVPNSKYSPRLELHPIIGAKENIREQDSQILYEQRYGSALSHFKDMDNQ
jgi:betaine-homocysteine S-methyltransferase